VLLFNGIKVQVPNGQTNDTVKCFYNIFSGNSTAFIAWCCTDNMSVSIQAVPEISLDRFGGKDRNAICGKIDLIKLECQRNGCNVFIVQTKGLNQIFKGFNIVFPAQNHGIRHKDNGVYAS